MVLRGLPLRWQIAVLAIAASFLFNLCFVCSEPNCEEAELQEAQDSFRNCVGSAKAGIIAKDNLEGESLCKMLSDFYVGCGAQIEALSGCIGQEEVENLKAIHLVSVAEILAVTKPTLNTKGCGVLRDLTSTTTTTSATDDMTTYQSYSADEASGAVGKRPSGVFRVGACMMVGLLHLSLVAL